MGKMKRERRGGKEEEEGGGYSGRVYMMNQNGNKLFLNSRKFLPSLSG